MCLWFFVCARLSRPVQVETKFSKFSTLNGKIFGTRSWRTHFAALDPYVMTSTQIFSVRPSHSVNKYNLQWNLWITVFLKLSQWKKPLKRWCCRTRQRVQSYRGFTLCQRSVRTTSPLPTTIRRARCFQVGDYAKISVSTAKRRCRPG